MTRPIHRRAMLSAEVLEVIESWESRGFPDHWESTPEQARRTLREFVSLYSMDGPDVHVEESMIPAGARRRVRVYRSRESAPSAAMLFLHGGGWVIGDLDTHDHICRHMAAEAGVIVVSLDYRLAPEFPFPAALYDAYDALAWTAKTFTSDGSGLVVAGDSAGANLAAALSVLALRRGGPAIDGQILFYPVTEREFDSSTFHQFGEGYFLSTASMRWFWQHYLPDGFSEAADLASLADLDSVAGIAQTLVVTAECDPLRHQSEAFAARMARDGVPVTLLQMLGMCHGFLSMTRDVPQARHALSLAATYLRSALGLGTPHGAP